MQIEERLHWLKEKVAPFEKYKFISDIAILLLLALCVGLWPALERWKIKTYYKNSMKAVSFLLAILTIAVSFSFFGNEFKKNETGVQSDLEMHKLRIIKNNKLLVKNIAKEVEERVVQQITNDKVIDEIVNEKESSQQYRDSLLESDDYEFFRKHPNGAENLLQEISSFDPGNGGDDNFKEAAVKAEKEIQEQYNPSKNSDVVKNSESTLQVLPESPEPVIEEFEIDKVVQDKIIDESVLSAKTVDNASSQFEQAILTKNVTTAPPRSKSYEDFEEIVEKVFRKGYGVSFKKWSNETMSKFINDIPFFSDIMDPIHDVLQDYIFGKIKKIYNYLIADNTNAASAELNQIGPEVSQIIETKVNKVNLITRFQNKVKPIKSKLKNWWNNIVNHNNNLLASSDRYLENLKAGNRWQIIRDNFKEKALIQSHYMEAEPPFTMNQWRKFKQVLLDWDQFMEDNKVEWKINGERNLEHNFYNFINRNPLACAAWGYILQQEDWNGAVVYYTSIAPDGTATGKPYYLLKYYCAMTGFCVIDVLYTREVDKNVGDLCPP